jgi:hypothetical protein
MNDDGLDMPLNRIVGATAMDLRLEINGQSRSVAWTSVESIYASIAVRDDNIPIMAFEIQDGRTRRSLIVGQVDAVWAELKAVLHIGLPEAVPVDVWERALADMPMVLAIFLRNWVR